MQASLVIVSSLLYATMALFVKLAAADFSIAELVFARAAPSAVAILLWARLTRRPIATPHLRVHMTRTLFGVSSVALGFYATSKLALATATTLEYTAPIFMTLYLLAFTRHRPGATDVLALAGGFVGILLLLRPTLSQDQAAPFFAGLASGALAALAYLQIRRMGALAEPIWRMVLLYAIAASALSAMAMPFTPPAHWSWRGLLLLAGISLTGVSAQFAMTRAYSHGVPTLPAMLQYSTVVFSALYGYFVWGDRPGWMAALGLTMIVGSGIVAALAMRRDDAGFDALHVPSLRWRRRT